MAQVIAFTFPLANGLHARPASHLEEAARPFRSAITLANLRSGRRASAHSVLNLVATDTHLGDPCELSIEGPDEAIAHRELGEFLARKYPSCDEPLQTMDAAGGDSPLPASLLAAGLGTHYRGHTASAGVGQGRLVIWTTGRPKVSESRQPADPATEGETFKQTARQVEAELVREVAASAGAEKSVLKAHLSMLRDPALTESVLREIAAGFGVPAAINRAVDALAAPLRESESGYLRERVLDLEDLGGRLLLPFADPAVSVQVPELPGDSVLAARTLTPSRFLALDRTRLRGLLLGESGSTSHTIILARSFGIPTLVGLDSAIAHLRAGEEAIVDGRLGVVIPRPSPGVLRYYQRVRQKTELISARAQASDPTNCAAKGRRMEVAANIAVAEEAPGAFSNGADGIGLFRTEMLFMGRETPPGEDEQFEAYASTVRPSGGKPVIIRLLDIGGDKPIPYLKLPVEQNPFLGRRGVRLYSENEALIKTQLRALVRASAGGSLRIMVPMVSSVEEVRACRRLLEAARAEVQQRGGAAPGDIPLGIMIEVPSAAFAMDELCKECDFFSIGTNDLAQYFFASDRGNPAVSRPGQNFEPSFLRILHRIVAAAKGGRRWIGLCGELGESPEALPLLLGLGLDEVSVAPPRVPAVRRACAGLEPSRCEKLLESALACGSAAEVLALLSRDRGERSAQPLVHPDLVILDSESRSKEEAILEMADALHLAGRTEWPEQVEAAVWQREHTYSTGFGDGFALPHCSTDAVTSHSMVIMRLREPVAWQSADGLPVGIAVLLAARAGTSAKEHLAAIARFSRLMMRDAFRETLKCERDPLRIVAIIEEALRTPPESRPKASQSLP